jgi:alpha-L-rhamnosidase
MISDRILPHLSRRTFLQLSAVLAPAPWPQVAPTTDAAPAPYRCLWLAEDVEEDTYVAFRGGIEIPAGGEVELRFLGASSFLIWLDGEYLAEGPARFIPEYPEYQSHRVRLNAGKHLLAVKVHYEGIVTRLLPNPRPFLMCQIYLNDAEIPVKWKALRLDGFQPRVRRINPELGWIEWADTSKQPQSWQAPSFDDASWTQPVEARVQMGEFQPLRTGELQAILHTLRAQAQGTLVEQFGYEQDDPPTRFYLRSLEKCALPPQGVWRRYDLGRVRLGRPRFVLDLPPGAAVEFACCEALERGRVRAWIPLSAGQSCNMDHFVARGGQQEFFPFTPKGGRFLEVHVIAPPESVRFVREEYVERTYHGTPDGSFESGDALLDRIWITGIETYRACSEDTVIDNPTRERGEWAGDVASVAMETAGVGYTDLRLFRRALVMFARSARKDGLVAGLCPGSNQYLSTFSAQWLSACLRYYQLTGDKDLLIQLLPAAEGNIAAFEGYLTPNGVTNDIGWGFVDWGYVSNPGEVDMAVNMHFLAAVRDMVKWCQTLGDAGKSDRYSALAARLVAILSAWLDSPLAGPDPWKAIGLHRAVLALRLHLLEGSREREAVAAIKRHINTCFPLDVSAPRLSGPDTTSTRLFTPYFAHFTMPELIKRGEMDYVLDVYRKAWGWALEDGRTTWLEVFDTRWSHCHQWAGCPTWQLSRFVLGLDPRFDRAPLNYALSVQPGSLRSAKGAIPLPNQQGVIKVHWTRNPGGIEYELQTPVPIVLHLDPRQNRGLQSPIQVERRLKIAISTGAV